MASRGGYKSLPADLDESSTSSIPEEQQQLGSGGDGDAASSRNADDALNNDAEGYCAGEKTANETSTSTARSKQTTSSGDKKIDPTGGLPTAEGVFVGDPVSQSTAYPTAAVSGNYNHNAAGAAHATVITSAPPPTYSNHVATGIAAASAIGGAAGRGIAIPQGGAGSGGAGQHTLIVVNAPLGHQFGQWGRHPEPFVCRACGFSGLSAATSVRESDRGRYSMPAVVCSSYPEYLTRRVSYK